MRVLDGRTFYEAGDKVWIWWISYDKDQKVFFPMVREVEITGPDETQGFFRTNDPVEDAILHQEWVAKGSPPNRLQHFTHQVGESRICRSETWAWLAADAYLDGLAGDKAVRFHISREVNDVLDT